MPGMQGYRKFRECIAQWLQSENRKPSATQHPEVQTLFMPYPLHGYSSFCMMQNPSTHKEVEQRSSAA